MTGNKKLKKSACKGMGEVVLYISPLKNSSTTTEDFPAGRPETETSEDRFPKENKKVVDKADQL